MDDIHREAESAAFVAELRPKYADFALGLKEYFDALRERGFSEDHALMLTSAFQTFLLESGTRK